MWMAHRFLVVNKLINTYIIINRIRQLAIVIENEPSSLPALEMENKQGVY